MRKFSLKHYTLVLTLVATMLFAPAVFAAESAGPAGALGINMGLMLSQIVNFLFVAVLLYFLLIGPMGKMLDERSNKIKKGLEDAAEAANARRNAEAEAEKVLAEARAQAQKVVEEGRQRGEELAENIRQEAQAAAEKTRADAQVAAEQARDAELSGLRTQVANISVALANRLIRENMTADKQKTLISDFFAGVPEGATNLSGEVTVISAMPLEDAEKATIEKNIKADSISYTVDPAILGGLVVRGGDNVIDGSVRSDLSNVAGRLK